MSIDGANNMIQLSFGMHLIGIVLYLLLRCLFRSTMYEDARFR